MHTFDSDPLTPPIMTETMAKLLLGQRHWREALDIYRELCRQHPDKAGLYKAEIAQIEGYFKPQTNPETILKRERTKKQIAQLENLLRIVSGSREERNR
ncbi:MAG: hypothetical protein JXR80_09580 [Deltaproteobacteria bacterium]|nr:hypothetical protein [Deltaproteobacteria bacterium]